MCNNSIKLFFVYLMENLYSKQFVTNTHTYYNNSKKY